MKSVEIVFRLCLCLQSQRIKPLAVHSACVGVVFEKKETKIMALLAPLLRADMQLRNFAHSCLSCKLECAQKTLNMEGGEKADGEEEPLSHLFFTLPITSERLCCEQTNTTCHSRPRLLTAPAAPTLAVQLGPVARAAPLRHSCRSRCFS